MKFELRHLTENEYSLWDDFVDESPQGTLFHKSYWLIGSGFRFVIYGCFRGGELFAGIPLVYRRIFGIKLASRFMMMYSGILFKEQEGKYFNKLSAEKEASQIIARRLKSDFHVVRLGFSPGMIDLQPLIWEGFSPDIQYTYIVPLNGDLEELWMGLEETTRTSIRKAQKNGIAVVQSDDFDQTIKMVEKTYTRRGRALRLRAEYCGHAEVLTRRNQCKSFFAKNAKGEYIAGIYIVWDQKRSYYLLGGYDSENSYYGASAMAIWEAIKFTKNDLGLEEFDFLGSMIPQVERFFRGFGGRINVRFNATWVKPYLKIALLAREAKNRLRF